MCRLKEINVRGTMPIGHKHEKKIKSIRRFIDKAGISPARLLARYGGEKLSGGFPKLELFRRILLCRFDEDLETYLGSMLGGSDLAHHRDGRTPAEYGVDLVLGWLKEDSVALLLKEHAMDVELSGSDMDREFLRSARVRSSSDLKVSFRGKCRNVETVYDASETWRNEDRCDLRDDKLTKIREQKGIVLGIDVLNAEAFVYCPVVNADLRVSYSPCHRGYGRKPAYSIHGVSGITVPLPEAFPVLAGMIGGAE